MSGHGAHDEHPPEPPPKKACHGPFDCYGMSQKKFWRIVTFVTFLTLGVVASTVVLANT